jgi:hypothetical protein
MRCSRIGCGAVAVATFCFDARATLVWVDALDPDRGTGAGVLCVDHADALTPPRGWYLQDRRTGRPRLWEERPAVARDTRRPRSPLRTAAGTDPPEPPAPGREAEPLPFDDAPPPRSADLDHLLEARSPLLARAFAGARRR